MRVQDTAAGSPRSRGEGGIGQMDNDGQSRGWVERPLGERDVSGDRSRSAGQPGTFIDQGAELDGVLRSKGSVRIDGEFRGELVAEDAVIAGETAAVEATVRARRVLVSGAVVGRIEATREVVLRPTAKIHADIETPCLEVQRGAVLNGRTTMQRPEQRLRASEAKQKAPAVSASTPSASA